MFSFIIVDKNGDLNECNVDKLENVYKKSFKHFKTI